MPDIFLIVLPILFVVGVVISIVEKTYKVGMACGFAAILLVVWAIVYCQQPWRNIDTYYAEVEERNGVQTVTVIKPNAQVLLFNVNARFGRTFKPGTKFKIEERDNEGIYVGVLSVTSKGEHYKYILTVVEPEHESVPKM